MNTVINLNGHGGILRHIAGIFAVTGIKKLNGEIHRIGSRNIGYGCINQLKGISGSVNESGRLDRSRYVGSAGGVFDYQVIGRLG